MTLLQNVLCSVVISAFPYCGVVIEQNFKKDVILFREQVFELIRLAIAACIAYLRRIVVPMGEVLRSGQLQKHLPPSIVAECDIPGTLAKLKTAQVSEYIDLSIHDNVSKYVKHCRVMEIQRANDGCNGDLSCSSFLLDIGGDSDFGLWVRVNQVQAAGDPCAGPMV